MEGSYSSDDSPCKIRAPMYTTCNHIRMERRKTILPKMLLSDEHGSGESKRKLLLVQYIEINAARVHDEKINKFETDKTHNSTRIIVQNFLA